MSVKVLRLLKVTAYALGLCGVMGILYWSFIWSHYYDILPHSPNPPREGST